MKYSRCGLLEKSVRPNIPFEIVTIMQSDDPTCNGWHRVGFEELHQGPFEGCITVQPQRQQGTRGQYREIGTSVESSRRAQVGPPDREKPAFGDECVWWAWRPLSGYLYTLELIEECEEDWRDCHLGLHLYSNEMVEGKSPPWHIDHGVIRGEIIQQNCSNFMFWLLLWSQESWHGSKAQIPIVGTWFIDIYWYPSFLAEL